MASAGSRVFVEFWRELTQPSRKVSAKTPRLCLLARIVIVYTEKSAVTITHRRKVLVF